MESFWFKNTNDTLDPLSVIIKLYIYSYKPLRTKISISNNKLEIQEYGSFQGAARFINGDDKSDIPVLSMPILYACNTYLSKDKMLYTKLFTQACESFEKMKITYEGNKIVSVINALKEYIQAFIDDDSERIKNTNKIGSYNSDSGKIKQAIYSNIASVWTERRIETVFNLINEIEMYNDIQNITLLLQPLYSYMSYIDTLVHGKLAELG